VIVDAHNDLLAELVHRRAEERPFARHWLPQLEQGGVGLQVCPIYTADTPAPDDALRAGLRAAVAFHRALAENDAVAQVTTAADLDGPAGLRLLLSLEGVEPLGSDPDLIDVFWQLGVRMVGLTWNARNAFADGLGVEDDRGLSDLGAELVDRLVERGAILDLAHASPRTYTDVLARTPRDTAVLVSHAGCRGVHDHPRNLDDGQLHALAERDGVLGIMCLPITVGSEGIEDLVDHVDYAVERLGPRGVGLGGDFIRQVNRALGGHPIVGGLLPPGMAPDAAVEGLAGPEHYPNLVDALRRRGYDGELLDGILGGNMLRLLRRGLPG
jgi:membrane dipeptidase